MNGTFLSLFGGTMKMTPEQIGEVLSIADGITDREREEECRRRIAASNLLSSRPPKKPRRTVQNRRN